MRGYYVDGNTYIHKEDLIIKLYEDKEKVDNSYGKEIIQWMINTLKNMNYSKVKECDQ